MKLIGLVEKIKRDSIIPGLVIVLVVALIARWINFHYEPLSSAAVALLIGIVVKNTVGLPTVCLPGVRFSAKKLLRIAIVLLGFGLSLVDVFRFGGASLGLIVVCISVAMLSSLGVGKILGLSAKLATMIGVGTSICGVSAVMATTSAIEADDEDTGLAVATVTLFGLLAVFLYPLIGGWLGLSESVFGIWAGVSVHDTSQVLATAVNYGNQAVEVATVVKLTRTLFLVPLLMIITARYKHKSSGSTATAFPWFVIVFVLMSVVRSLGDAVLGANAGYWNSFLSIVGQIPKYLIPMALAAVGLGLDFRGLGARIVKPLALGFVVSVAVSSLSLALIRLFF